MTSQGANSGLEAYGPPLLVGGALSPVELEGDKEFLEALARRLDEITGRPKGRFVISYLPGHPGARRPPRVL